MHKRAFQALKRTFMHVSGLPPAFVEILECLSGVGERKTLDEVGGWEALGYWDGFV